MSRKLPSISGKEAVKAFARAGWHLDRISGSHAIMRKEGSTVLEPLGLNGT
jgi:predicted RNA binding protein YcfA (HicA-like mRNA interferase family)